MDKALHEGLVVVGMKEMLVEENTMNNIIITNQQNGQGSKNKKARQKINGQIQKKEEADKGHTCHPNQMISNTFAHKSLGFISYGAITISSPQAPDLGSNSAPRGMLNRQCRIVVV